MTSPSRIAPALVAAMLLAAAPSLSAPGDDAGRPPPAAPVLSPGVGRDLPEAMRALAEAGSLPGGLRPSGVEVAASEIRLRLVRDDGPPCTIRLGPPSSADAAARGRWLALLPDPDASCTAAGPTVLQRVEATLPGDPWIAGARTAAPTRSAPGAPVQALPLAFALLSGALGLLLAGIGLAVGLSVALRREP